MVYRWAFAVDEVVRMMSLKGAQFPRDVILHAVFFYVRYAGPAALSASTVRHSARYRWVGQMRTA